MNCVVDVLAGFLAAPPEPVLLAARIGAKRPAASSDLPAVAVSLVLDAARGRGVGRLVREGETLNRQTTTVAAQPGVDGFSQDLRTWWVTPLPLQRGAVSNGLRPAAYDVSVRRITDAAHPVPYRMVERPGRDDEFAVDALRARVVFGAAQRAGEVLEISHWTLVWRDAIRADRFAGTAALDVWASTFAELDDLARRVQRRLADSSAARERGFLKLSPKRLDTAAEVRFAPAVGSPFAAWVQRLEYSFVFEAEDGGAESAGTRIVRIDADLGQEAFAVPDRDGS